MVPGDELVSGSLLNTLAKRHVNKNSRKINVNLTTYWKRAHLTPPVIGAAGWWLRLCGNLR